nr:hypothetical protein [Paenibacillus bovis]
MNFHNLVNEENQLTPNYRLNEKELYFDIYISPEQEVCVVGRYDQNYIGWCSFTKVDSKSHNAALLDEITNSQWKFVSNEHRVLGERYKEIKNWHVFRITKTLYKDEPYFYSTASPIYFKNGSTFASEIHHFYKHEKAKSEYRIIDKKYSAILKGYLKLLDSDDSLYYLRVKPLIDLIQSESYLKLCPDANVRAIYLQCLEKCNQLYNTYMSEVR